MPMAKSKKSIKKQENELNRIAKTYALTVLGLFVILYSILIPNYFFFSDKFYLSTKVGDINISGLTFTEAQDLINEQIENYYSQSTELSVNNELGTVKNEDLKIMIEYKDLLSSLYQSQHNDEETFVSGIFSSILKHLRKNNSEFEISFDIYELNAAIIANFDSIETVKEPEIIFSDGTFVAQEGRIGHKITTDSQELLVSKAQRLDHSAAQLSTEETYPLISNEQATEIAAKANELSKMPITLKAQNYTVTAEIINNPDWLEFKISDVPETYAIYFRTIYFKFGNGFVAGESTDSSINKPTFNILLNPEAIESFVNESIVSKLDDRAQNIYLRRDENDEIVVEGFLKDGLALETEEAVKLIVENFKQGILTNELPVTIQAGQIFDETGLELGIKELIGFGESDFAHSDANRVTNVTVGLSKFQNVIVAPGETFNYADYIGEIDAANGFMPGWVIKNRTENVLEYGGGICQTSTTLFRAAFYGGLPILERHQHSYDVKYYRWPQPGLDASVYVPYASLKWKNDTGNHILIQQLVDKEAERAYVWLYGTNDGRQVNVSGPEIYGKYWPSSSIEIPSENLTPGAKILYSGATAGFQTDWNRTVTYVDGTVDEYNVHSSYTAVPATYLVGQ